jgi:hypothetical protein
VALHDDLQKGIWNGRDGVCYTQPKREETVNLMLHCLAARRLISHRPGRSRRAGSCT